MALRIPAKGMPSPEAGGVAGDLLALPHIKTGGGVGKVFEFAEPAIAQLSTDERATLTNMTAELGGNRLPIVNLGCRIVSDSLPTSQYLK